jgi:DNA-directed RNA polymerase sigma subunit (sigma70/sigma32)
MADETGELGRLIREAGALKPLQRGELGRLLRSAAVGDAASRERLIAAYLPTVVRLAAARADQGLSLPDLVQEGSIGFLQAVLEFPGGPDEGFAAFAEARINQQLSNAIDSEAVSVRDDKLLVTAAEDFARVQLMLRRTLQRTPTDKEVAEKLEWTVDRVRYVAVVVAEARRRHDAELLAYVDPSELGLEDEGDLPDKDIASLN